MQISLRYVTSIGSYLFLVSLLGLLNEWERPYIKMTPPPHFPSPQLPLSLASVTVIYLGQTNRWPNTNTIILLLFLSSNLRGRPLLFTLTTTIQRGGAEECTSRPGGLSTSSMDLGSISLGGGWGRGIQGRGWREVDRKQDGGGEVTPPPHFPSPQLPLSLASVTVIYLGQTNRWPNTNTIILLLFLSSNLRGRPLLFTLTTTIQRGGAEECTSRPGGLSTSSMDLGSIYLGGWGRGIQGRGWREVDRKQDGGGEVNGLSRELSFFLGGKIGRRLWGEEEKDRRQGPCRNFCSPILQLTCTLPQEVKVSVHPSEGNHTKVVEEKSILSMYLIREKYFLAAGTLTPQVPEIQTGGEVSGHLRMDYHTGIVFHRTHSNSHH